MLELVNTDSISGTADSEVVFVHPSPNWRPPTYILLPKLRRRVCVFFCEYTINHGPDHKDDEHYLTILVMSRESGTEFKEAKKYITRVFGKEDIIKYIYLEYDVMRDAWCPISGVRSLFEKDIRK